jgi:hypothetical protein
VGDLMAAAVAAARGPFMRTDTESMATFLEDIASQLSSLHERNSHNSTQLSVIRNIDLLLAELRGDIEEIHCKHCVKINNATKACDGTTDDDTILSGNPLCWRFVNQLFEKMVELAEELYLPYLEFLNTYARLQIILHTRITHQAEMLAKTEFPKEDGLGNRVAIVTLDLPIAEFDAVHLQRMAYYLFHEIFVHSAEGWAAVGRRESTNERCTFREGFVDAAAAYALNQRVRCALEDTVHAQFAEEFALGTESAHRERVSQRPGNNRITDDPNEKKKRDIKALRTKGWKVFKRFVDQNQAIPGLNLAICLNVISLSHDQRNRLTQFLDRATDTSLGKRGRITVRFGKLLKAAAAHDVTQAGQLIAGVVSDEDF